MVKYIKIKLEDKVHLEFRKMCLETGTNMQQRLTNLIVRDIQNNKNRKQETTELNSLQLDEDEGHKETNGHHVQQQAKVTKVPKHHKTYKGQTEETGDLDIWDEDGDLDILDEDIKTDSQLSNQGNSQTNSYDFQQVKVTKPRKEHKRYKNKVGELLAGIDKDRAKVLLDGDIEILHSDEIEFIG